jgi:hypothetical protein
MKNTTQTQFNGTIRWILVVLSVIMFCWLEVSGQPTHQDLKNYLEGFPDNLVLREDVSQRYHIVTDYFNKDIYGNFMNKMRVSGDYTRGLEGGKVKWNNVYVANANQLDQSFPQGEKQEFMENFTYIPSEKMMLESSFENFPQQLVHLKNLVWDMMGIEAFAWVYLDSLKLNQSISASIINGQVEMDGIGVFENRDIQLRWTGISEMNQEICAVIEYLAMDNPLNAEFGDFKMKGRSHYWGTIWVSMEDKQIEHAFMYEDVVMDLKLPGQPNNQLINTTREIVFEKLNEEL